MLGGVLAGEEGQPSDRRAITAEAGLDSVELKCGLEDERLRTERISDRKRRAPIYCITVRAQNSETNNRRRPSNCCSAGMRIRLLILLVPSRQRREPGAQKIEPKNEWTRY
jgi:hypothetical protein